MKSKKFLILAVTISFPVILYLFLRFFGQNKYDLPYFFQEEGVKCLTMVADTSNELLDVSSLDSVSVNSVLDSSISILMFPSSTIDNQSLKNELNRTVQDLKGRVNLRLIAFYQNGVDTSNLLALNEVEIDNFIAADSSYKELIDCYFKLPTPEYKGEHPTEEKWPFNKTIVLIDAGKHIRGYYNGFETKEVDRLILEVNVLLSIN